MQNAAVQNTCGSADVTVNAGIPRLHHSFVESLIGGNVNVVAWITLCYSTWSHQRSGPDPADTVARLRGAAMRLPSFLFATIFVAFFSPTHVDGQTGDQQQVEEQLVPYHRHHDTRFGHDRFYPDRGAILRDVPKGAAVVNYAGLSYRFHDGVWFEPRGPAFMVVAPPMGVIVPTLPTFSTVLARGGQTYLYCNDIYYQPRPDLGGYEVVNDPLEEKAEAGSGTVVGAPLAVASASAPQAAAVPVDTASAKVSPPSQIPAAGSSATAPTSIHAATPPVSVPAEAIPASAPGATIAAVPLPTGSSSDSSSGSPKANKVFVYPRNGQSPDQQERDRYECYRFAVAQSGFDPMRSTGGVTQAPKSDLQSDYGRAQGACLDAHGYTVR